MRVVYTCRSFQEWYYALKMKHGYQICKFPLCHVALSILKRFLFLTSPHTSSPKSCPRSVTFTCKELALEFILKRTRVDRNLDKLLDIGFNPKNPIFLAFSWNHKGTNTIQKDYMHSYLKEKFCYRNPKGFV